VPVRVTPRARTNAVEPGAAPDGSPLLCVSVTAAPEGGRANAAVIDLVARAAGAPKSAFSVVRGLASRDKLLRWRR
jgi:uncharacterized protein YggU (UPF0235/DUF167 family)